MTSIPDSDYQALQGTWQQISLEDSGVLNPPDAHSAPRCNHHPYRRPL